MHITFAAPLVRGQICRLLGVALLTLPATAQAQTDYFNTDRGRPLHVQDAIVLERYAFELQAAPLRWSRASGARVVWSVEPELAYGILPRTQIEVGAPLYVTEGFEGGTRAGFGAAHVSLLHALNTESLGFPALAVNAVVAVPAGNSGPRRLYTTLGVLATRTTPLGRVHLNVDATQGDEIADDDSRWVTSRGAGLEEVSRWTAGVAVDRAMPLRSMLVGAELTARQPIRGGSTLEWQAATGVRWQLDPRWALDAGLARTLGDDHEWSLTFGAARSFGLINLIPLSR
jgi:hypothetical protein